MSGTRKIRLVAEGPVACSLDGAGLAARGDEFRALGERALLDLDRRPGRLVARFRDDPGVASAVVAVAEHEHACCSFFAIEVRRDAGHVILEVRAPSDGDPFLDLIAGALRGDDHGMRAGS